MMKRRATNRRVDSMVSYFKKKSIAQKLVSKRRHRDEEYIQL